VRQVLLLPEVVDLGQADIGDLTDDLAEHGLALKERLEDVAATIGCHGSVRAGRRLGAAEMDALKMGHFVTDRICLTKTLIRVMIKNQMAMGERQ